MLSGEASEYLERLQRNAVNSIFGLNVSYEDCLERSGLQRLDVRRRELFETFAKKMSESPIFAPTWFPLKKTYL